MVIGQVQGRDVGIGKGVRYRVWVWKCDPGLRFGTGYGGPSPRKGTKSPQAGDRLHNMPQ